MTSFVQIASIAMIVYGALLAYDGFLLAWRMGFGKVNLIIIAAGAAMMILFGFVNAEAGAALGTLRGCGVVGAALCGAVFICGFIGYIVASAVVLGRRPANDYCYVIVLGAGLIDGVRPSRLLAGRLDLGKTCLEAAAASEEIAQSRCMVVCGGRGSDERVAEARAMHDYLVGKGVPEQRIIKEDRSRTTDENLAFAKQIIDARIVAQTQANRDKARIPASENVQPIDRRPPSPAGSGRCLVVTSNFHALRAYLMAKRHGLDAAGVVGKHTRLYYLPGAAVRDYTGVLRLFPVAVLAVLCACAALAAFLSFGAV